MLHERACYSSVRELKLEYNTYWKSLNFPLSTLASCFQPLAPEMMQVHCGYFQLFFATPILKLLLHF